MIIRQPIQCEICQKIHVTRIGLGRSRRQEHVFPCHGCEQDIGFILKLFPEKGEVECEEWISCHPTQEEPRDSPIVNLEANFLMPTDMKGVDRSFARMAQIRQVLEAREAAGTLSFTDMHHVPKGARGDDPKTEWEDLRRAWSLTRSGQHVLARGKIKSASNEYYPDAPLSDLSEWVFRFEQLIGGEPLKKLREMAASELKKIAQLPGFSEFTTHYKKEMAPKRGRLYFDIINSYFLSVDDFSQVHFLFASGVEIGNDMEVTSFQFDKTKMFYGNAFETLGATIDILALLNNIKNGRKWDSFEQLTLKKYYELDKISRSGPFNGNANFTDLFKESDNQLRNASHHGSIEIDKKKGTIKYRAGKGGQGDENEISYTKYIYKCMSIFTQIIAIHSVELIMMKYKKEKPL